jgi:hypothetical protein
MSTEYTPVVGDAGTTLRFTVREAGAAIDISTATTKQILLRKPDGTVVAKTAGFGTNGSDGVLTYSILTADLDTAGEWRARANLVLSTGWSGQSDIDAFTVLAKWTAS